MNEKEILVLAVLGVKKEIEERCAWVAKDAFSNRETLEEIRLLIAKLDELDKKLADCYSEEE